MHYYDHNDESPVIMTSLLWNQKTAEHHQVCYYLIGHKILIKLITEYMKIDEEHHCTLESSLQSSSNTLVL